MLLPVNRRHRIREWVNQRPRSSDGRYLVRRAVQEAVIRLVPSQRYPDRRAHHDVPEPYPMAIVAVVEVPTKYGKLTFWIRGNAFNSENRPYIIFHGAAAGIEESGGESGASSISRVCWAGNFADITHQNIGGDAVDRVGANKEGGCRTAIGSTIAVGIPLKSA